MLTNLEREGDHRHVTWRVIQEEHMAGNISQVSGCATGLKQSFSLSNMVFGRLGERRKTGEKTRTVRSGIPALAVELLIGALMSTIRLPISIL